MNGKTKSLFAGLAAIIASVVVVPFAVGQEADKDKGNNDGVSIEEIIVTASKRGAKSVQDTVGGVRAITSDFMKTHGLRSFEDVARFEPSLQFAKLAEGDLRPIIRGIQSPGASTVGVYFDETVITGVNLGEEGGRTPDIGAYDMERVEILKGPQGTLFGASSMTGTVRFISNKPAASGFDANVRMGARTLKDGDNGFNVDGMVNIPLVKDVLAVRGVFWQETGGGFIDQYAGLDAVTKIEDANEVDKTGGRAMIRYTPTDNLTVDAYYLRQDLEVDGPVGFSDGLTGSCLPLTVLVGAPFLIGEVAPPLDCVAGERIISSPTSADSWQEIKMVGVTVNYDLGFGSVLATGSRYELANFRQRDASGAAVTFGEVDIDAFFATGIVRLLAGEAINTFQDREVWSTEVRFSSDFDGPFNLVTGFFYQSEDRLDDFLVQFANPVTGLTLCDRIVECYADPTSAAAQTVILGTDLSSDEESFALFGNAEYELTDAWTLGAGIRYYEIDSAIVSRTTQAFQGSIPFTIPPAFGGPVQTVPIITEDDSTTQDKITWEASVGYELIDTQLYYFKAATGFRQGGINEGENTAAQQGVVIPCCFGPDEVLSLEMGAKTSWFSERLIANAAYFKMFWDDVQVPGQDFTGTANFISNAAEAEVDGVELELFARPTDQWAFTFGLTWLDAKLTKDQEFDFDPTDQGITVAAGFAGDNIPKVPEWAFSGSAGYMTFLPFLEDVEMALRADFSYTDDSTTFFNDTFDNNLDVGDYLLFNLRADFDYQNWGFSIFCNNVTDEVAAIDRSATSTNVQYTVTTEPRSVGAQLRWNFN